MIRGVVIAGWLFRVAFVAALAFVACCGDNEPSSPDACVVHHDAGVDPSVNPCCSIADDAGATACWSQMLHPGECAEMRCPIACGYRVLNACNRGGQ